MAFSISGFLFIGSSSGNGKYSIFDFELVNEIIVSANSEIVISSGLPKFTGKLVSSLVSVFINLIKPSTISDTKQKLLVCFPSP